MVDAGEAASREAGEDDALHEALRAAVEVPTKGTLWTRESTFVPALLDTVYGDGRALFWLTTVNSRPAYYVVRGDSSWEVEDDHPLPADDLPDHADDGDAPEPVDFRDREDRIVDAIEGQFGTARIDEVEFEDRHGREPGPSDSLVDMPWPALDCEGGTFWGRLGWPDVPGLTLADHPTARFERVAADYAPAPSPSP